LGRRQQCPTPVDSQILNRFNLKYDEEKANANLDLFLGENDPS